jgi:hypothetical protein
MKTGRTIDNVYVTIDWEFDCKVLNDGDVIPFNGIIEWVMKGTADNGKVYLATMEAQHHSPQFPIPFTDANIYQFSEAKWEEHPIKKQMNANDDFINDLLK